MPVSSEIELCNRALFLVGVEPLSSLLDNSKAGRVLRLYYPEVRDRLLAESRWGFATARIAPTPTLVTNLTQYDYQFSVETDPPMLTLLDIVDENTGYPLPGLPFLVENGILYCNIENPLLVYTFRQTDVKKFSEPFITCLKYSLAAEISVPITEKVRPDLIAQAEIAMASAIKQNAKTTKTRRTPSQSWVTARSPSAPT